MCLRWTRSGRKPAEDVLKHVEIGVGRNVLRSRAMALRSRWLTQGIRGTTLGVPGSRGTGRASTERDPGRTPGSIETGRASPGLRSIRETWRRFQSPRGAAGSRQSLPHADVTYGLGMDVVSPALSVRRRRGHGALHVGIDARHRRFFELTKSIVPHNLVNRVPETDGR